MIKDCTPQYGEDWSGRVLRDCESLYGQEGWSEHVLKGCASLMYGWESWSGRVLTVSEEQWEQLTQERDEAMAMMEARHRSTTEKMRAELEAVHKSRNSREQEVNILNRLESCYLAIAGTFNRLAKWFQPQFFL